ncbi:rab-GTPase-TBC domain-containing protein [Cunninghamella echinulata]|nr:rab-GTPase-TBC domain-containing protein [Cunninghamella echinulata]
MRRVLSSSSSLASLTTNSSAKSKSSIMQHHHLKWDWTIEESTLFHQRDENGKINNKNTTESSSINEVTERDIYGFKKPTEWVSLKKIHEFDHLYQPILLHQKEKWVQLLEEHDNEFPPLSSRVKRYVRKGIPHIYRGKAWMHYSGAQRRMEANPGLYDTLLNTALTMDEQQNEYIEVIVRDLHRTFPDNLHFTCQQQQDEHGNMFMNPDTNPILVSLKNVLFAFSLHSPQVGYCQSLNYVVGLFLLMLMDQHHYQKEPVAAEEQAFWLLVALVHDYAPNNMYDVTMEGSIIEQMVLMMMISERMPSIWNKLANGRCFWDCEQDDNMPSVTLVTNHWFLTMFINILPIETVLRIWDCFFIEGYRVLYKVALTLIKMNEHRIWALNDPMEIFPILQNMPRRLIDCHQFMERVFNKTGIASDITTQEIERIRSLFKDRRKQRRYKKFDEMVRNNNRLASS